MTHNLRTPTMATLFAAGLIFLLALVLGIWKYRQMATSPDHLAHPYVDIAHRAALLRCMRCPGQAAAIFASSSGAVVLLAGATAFHLAARRGLALLRAATLSLRANYAAA